MRALVWLLAVLLVATADNGDYSSDHRKVTCGSSIKLTHVPTGYKLHSHSIKYGSGSGQQSVTAFPNKDDVNSYFTVKTAHAKKPCRRGEPIGKSCSKTIAFIFSLWCSMRCNDPSETRRNKHVPSLAPPPCPVEP